MSGYVETPICFSVEGESLFGIVGLPVDAAVSRAVGVVIVVGGPQYRAGSHRQFTLLARRLASEGFATMRFDYRGMGDSTGDPRSFAEIEADIAEATRALMEYAGVREVVLWGLCDAASAALLSVPQLAGVAGLALVNPWVSSAQTLASVHVKHYYGARVRDPEFWRKLLTGKVAVWGSVRGFLTKALAAIARPDSDSHPEGAPFQTRMAQGWRSFPGPVLLALSGNDFTSREFLDYIIRNQHWSGLLDAEGTTRRELPHADHTFSTDVARRWLEDATLEWLTGRVLKSAPYRPDAVR